MAQAVATRPKCVKHPDDDAWVTCQVCEDPLCTMCIHGLDPDKPLCRQCATTAPSVDYLRLLSRTVTFLPFLLGAGMVVFIKAHLDFSWPTAILIACGTSFLIKARIRATWPR